jgi:hypothetical protein
MKRIITIAVFAFTVILSVGRTLAQVPAIRVDVPFNFTAGDKLLPPGLYTITLASAGIIEIRNRDQHISIGTTVLPDNRKSENGGELVFARYGNQYFLREILCDSAAMNVNLPATRSEKRVRMQEAMVESANHILLAMK